MQSQIQSTHVTKLSPSSGIVHTPMSIISTLQNCRHRSDPQADWTGYNHSGVQATCPTFLCPHQPLALSEEQV